MLPLVAQRLALANPGLESSLTSTSIILAQIVTILMARLMARADLPGRKPLLIVALVALCGRGAFCAVIDGAPALLLSQALDGVAFGLFDALLPLILADIMAGSGHYSLARGVSGTIQGAAGSLAQGVAGLRRGAAWL